MNRTRLTVGGNIIDYPGEVATPTSDMLVAQILFNNVISKKRARFMIIDISNLYLMTQLKRPEYICIHVRERALITLYQAIYEARVFLKGLRVLPL